MTDQPNRRAAIPAPKDAQAITKRVLSAAALIAGSLTLTWLGGVPFTLMVIGVGILMMWEWKRMVGVAPEADLQISVLAYAAIALVALVGLVHPAAIAGPIALGLSACLIFRPLLIGAGILYVVLPVAALLWLRADDPHGFWAVVFLFAVVWATDTFAMVIGRIAGGPPLWRSVSPNKTWSGAIGGLLAAGIVGGALMVYGPQSASWFYGAALGAVLSVCAQVGDLVESAVKRACRVKDTSGLIPGHGGVLDRMDGIVGASVGAAIALLIFAPDHPARALITGG